MKLLPSILALFLLITAGCGPSKDHTVAAGLKGGLDASNQIIKDLVDLNFRTLDERLDDPLLHSQAIIWFPVIKQLRRTSSACMAYIDSLATGKAKEGNELAVRLSAYQKILRSIDTGVSFGVSHLVDDFGRSDDTVLEQMILSKIKNDMLTAEYKISKYCLERVSLKGWCIDYFPEMMMSNTRFRKGDTVCAMGWYGSTVSGIDLKLTARGDTIPQTDDVPIVYKFVANDPPGTYSLPIRLQYLKPDGSTAIFQKVFKYTILR
jgi:hypothetical protein